MAWWTSDKVEIKQQSKFIVMFSETFFLPNVVSVTKPSFTTNISEHQLINHVFKYPGILKWNTVKIDFVDMNANGGQFDTAEFLSQMLNNSGYSTPDVPRHKLASSHPSGSTISTMIKSSTIANSFGSGIDGRFKHAKVGGTGTVKIVQITPNAEAIETWTLYNPIINSIQFGNLSYDSDEAVQYTMDIDYDYAKLS